MIAMNKEIRTVGEDAGTLADDVRSLLAATANVAEEKVVEARKRLSGALDKSRTVAERGARRADSYVRGHSYETAAIAFGIGALVGLLLGRLEDR